MRRTALPLLLAAVVLAALAAPASADHTDPTTQLSSTSGQPIDAAMYARGEGAWDHIAHFPPNPGTDLKFFRKDGAIYASSGTLGQGAEQHVGQRITELVNADGEVAPRWVADHGSAACNTANPTGTTGLQHDIAVTPRANAQLLIDATDATGRCHDAPGGGLEIIDITGLGQEGFEPREIHLTRHLGTSHTVTADPKRPWIIYNSTSDFSGRPWIDVLDIRSCLGLGGKSLEEKRRACRPEVFRIPFDPAWTSQRTADGAVKPGSDAACHDITARGDRIYCAALNATAIFKVGGLTDGQGNIKGSPLDCMVTNGTSTSAKVTDCTGTEEGRFAKGWKFLGSYIHPGRDDGRGGTTGNSNFVVPSDEGVAVSHESDPTMDGKYMFVTDERGGGVYPGGASCAPGIDNPYGNGGIHVLDTRDKSNIDYALTPEGEKAVWISDDLIPAPTFCTVHVIEQIPNEQRLIVGYYSQGAKIVDYYIDDQGRWTFDEVASLTLPGTQAWAVEDFKITENDDGTNTYYFMSSDIGRGIDVLSWTGPPNPVGAQPPASAAGVPADAGLALAGFVILPIATAIRRRRR